MGIGLLGIIKTAAEKIPWAKVAQNTPLVVDLLGKAKAQIRQHDASQRNLEEQVKSLHDENARLAAALLQLSDRLQLVTSRVSTLLKVSVVSLLFALSALVLWMLK